MSCTTCRSGKYIDGVCDVHRIVDNDVKIRRVAYCRLCQAFICSACKNNYIKRAKAYLKQ